MTILTRPPRRFLALLAAAALAVLAVLPGGPAGAQDRGGANTSREPEVCVGAGTALAVLSPGAAIADVIAPRATNRGTTIGAAGPAKIVLTKPGLVGACADFRGYWTVGAAGAEAATLRWMAVAADGTETEVAVQNVADAQTGPASRDARLRAVARVEAPGASRFVAILTVSATPDGGAAVERTARLPIVVDLRLPGAIEGRVLGSDGQPLAGAVVRAHQLATDRPIALPFEPPRTDGAQADRDPSAGGATTDADGRYRLPVQPGMWAVRAEAAMHKVQWYDGAAVQRDADPVAVPAGASVAGIDFHLAAADPTPTPAPMASVSGIVRGADGLPLAGALVRAQRAGNATIGDRSNTAAGSAARTGDDGRYTLAVPVGSWLVAAEADGHVRQYFDHQAEARAANVLALAPDEARSGIDFDLAHKPQATIRGTILLADGTAAAGARVMAVRRDVVTNPAGPLPTTGPRVDANERGEYVLVVEPGSYAVGASPKANRSSTPPVWRWWDGKETIDEADLVVLTDGAVREGILVRLP